MQTALSLLGFVRGPAAPRFTPLCPIVRVTPCWYRSCMGAGQAAVQITYGRTIMSTDPDAPDVPTANAQTDSARTVPASTTWRAVELDEGRAVPFDGLLDVLAYMTAPNAELYVAVMDAAVDARDRFRLQLRPGDIATALDIDRDTAAAALNYLAAKNALHRTYDARKPRH